MASLDIQALIAFIAVAETGSFSLAADKLFLTQSAVSKRVAQLEQQLQTPVFDRVKKKIWLTEAGKVLLPKAKQIIQSLKDTQQAISDIAGKTSGKLAIAFSHHIGLHRLGPHLNNSQASMPRLISILALLILTMAMLAYLRVRLNWQ